MLRGFDILNVSSEHLLAEGCEKCGRTRVHQRIHIYSRMVLVYLPQWVLCRIPTHMCVCHMVYARYKDCARCPIKVTSIQLMMGQMDGSRVY